MQLHLGQSQGRQLGRLMRRAGFARLSGALRPRGNIRTALMHEVPNRDRGRLRALIEAQVHNRRPIGAGELLSMCSGRSPWTTEPSIAFTFDDGLLSSYQAAQTVLNPLGIKAAFFLPTAIFELRTEDEMRAFRMAYLRARSTPSGWEESRVMTRDHVLELHRQGHTILPHTHTHKALAAIASPADVDSELRRPRQIIEDLVQTPAPAIALPYGDDRSVGRPGFEAMTRLYDICFTSVPGASTARTDPYFLYRDGFDPRDDPEDIDNLLSGAMDLPYRLKMLRLRRRAAPVRT